VIRKLQGFSAVLEDTSIHLVQNHAGLRIVSVSNPGIVLWRSCSVLTSARFIGFTFYKTDNSVQGIQNTLFAIFMQAVVYPPLVFQIIPKFAANRELYEVSERASKMYAWPAFLIAQSIAEMPYQILMGCIVFVVWNYTVLGIQSSEQQGLLLLFMVQFFVWAGTIAHMVISAIPLPEVAGTVSVVLFALSLLFSGVIQPPTIMPHF
jgi:ATP-binding cassette, subfamily G (WHITE), member 2, PDR